MMFVGKCRHNAYRPQHLAHGCGHGGHAVVLCFYAWTLSKFYDFVLCTCFCLECSVGFWTKLPTFSQKLHVTRTLKIWMAWSYTRKVMLYCLLYILP